MNQHEELRELNKIFARVAPTLLALGCDSDLLVKQLFQPLMLQLTHYYSSTQKFKSEETSVLVDTIMVSNSFILFITLTIVKAKIFLDQKNKIHIY